MIDETEKLDSWIAEAEAQQFWEDAQDFFEPEPSPLARFSAAVLDASETLAAAARLVACVGFVGVVVGYVLIGSTLDHVSQSTAVAARPLAATQIRQQRAVVTGRPLSAAEAAQRAASEAPKPVEPAAICAAAGRTVPMSPWAVSALFPEEWECLSSDADQGGGTNADTLFVIARGRNETTLSQMRFKISAKDARSAARGSSKVREILEASLQTAGRRPPDGLLQALQTMTPAKLVDRDTKFEFIRERGTDERFNLMITFPKPKG